MVNGSGQGIDRLNAILRALGRRGGQGLRLVDVATETGLSKSTAHRLLSSIVQTGLAEQDEESGLYYLGFDIVVMGAVAANRFGIINLAAEGIQSLVDRTGDTAFLSVRSNFEAVCIDRREGAYPVKVLTLSVGDRRPLGIGAGSLALLAFQPESDITAIVEATRTMREPYVNFDTPRLYELIAETRAQGYSLNRGGIVREMCAVGVPILDAERVPVAAFSVAAIDNRLRGQRLETVVGWLKEEARGVERKLAELTREISPAKLRRVIVPGSA